MKTLKRYENHIAIRDAEKFLANALDWAVARNGEEKIIIKFITNAREFELIGYDGVSRKSLAHGELFDVVDTYRKWCGMPAADAIAEFEKSK